MSGGLRPIALSVVVIVALVLVLVWLSRPGQPAHTSPGQQTQRLLT